MDLVQGLLPNILGYAHEAVDRAVHARASLGHSFSLAHPLEVELAERLTKLFPSMELIRFGRNGSDATTAAIRVARAFTSRERVAVCGYHGWHDWFIGTTTRTAGVPRAVIELAHTFPYNDVDALDRLLSSHPGEFAAVIMEPFDFFWPAPGYLAAVKEVVRRHGALLVFDEICTGFHLGPGGAQRLFGVAPDLTTLGKALGNGYPISCVGGREDVMRCFEDVFVSFTFAGELSSIAAAMAVLDVLEHTDAYARLDHAGRVLADGVRVLAEAAGLQDVVSVLGHPNWSLVRFTDGSGADDLRLRALWNQEMHRRGVFVIATHNVCAALDHAAREHVLGAYAESFKYIASVRSRGIPLEGALDGPVPTPAFRVRG